MQLTREQFEQIAPLLPRQRGNVRLENFQVVNAILYVAANGCKWRSLPSCHGPWHTIYMRMSRWAKAGVLDALAEQLQRRRLKHVPIKVVSLDSTIVKVHPDGTGAPKKTALRPLAKAVAAGAPRCIWWPPVRAMCWCGA